MGITEEKAALRTKMREARKAAQLKYGKKAVEDLTARLVSLPAIKHAQRIGVYSAYGSELSLEPAIKILRSENPTLTVAYPLMVSDTSMLFVKFDKDDDTRVLENPTMRVTGISQERIVDPASLDFVLVPGLAFDTRGRRLGQGGGYYDRILTHVATEASIIGIAYDEQIVDAVPTGIHDARIHYILTPTRLLNTGK